MRPSNELAAPEGLSWDGGTAKWNAVTDATGYSVQLYKNGTEDGNKVGSPVSATGTSHDFSATFQSEGDGTYYFAVQATGSKNPSLWSDPSAGYEVSKDTTAPSSPTAPPPIPARPRRKAPSRPARAGSITFRRWPPARLSPT